MAHEKHKLASVAGGNGNEGPAAHTPATQHFQVSPCNHLTRASSPNFIKERARTPRKTSSLSRKMGLCMVLRCCWNVLGAAARCVLSEGRQTISSNGKGHHPCSALKIDWKICGHRLVHVFPISRAPTEPLGPRVPSVDDAFTCSLQNTSTRLRAEETIRWV